MPRFSIGTAIGEGFSLIRRRPLAVLVWGVLMVAPFLAALALMLPIMAEVFASMPAEDADPAAAEAFAHGMFSRMVQFQAVSGLINIAQLAAMAIVYTAAMRAVLRPAERGWFSLRVGMDELRVAVVGVAIGMGLYFAILFVVLFGAAIGLAAWSLDSAAGFGVVLALLGGGVVIGLVWALGRVSLIAPASVLYRDFAFDQGWRLAAGKGWPLGGMMVLISLIIFAAQLAVMIVVAGAVWALASSGALPPSEMAGEANPFPAIEAWLAGNWHWVALGAVAASMAYGMVVALSVAPFASACRQLADSGAAAPPGPPEPAAAGAVSPSPDI